MTVLPRKASKKQSVYQSNINLIFVVSILLFLLIPTTAQSANEIPGPASPSRIPQRFQPPVGPTSQPEITIPGPSAPVPSAKALQIKFVLHAVVLEGCTVYKSIAVAPLWAKLVGKEITLAQIYSLRDALTAKYRRDGYILSQVIVPPQKIARGVVHLRAVEGYISKVTIEGHPHDARGLIRAMGERITATRPLTASALERYTLLIKNIPGLAVQSVIRPAHHAPGAADLMLFVKHSTVTGYAAFDNHGSKAIGPLQFMVGGQVNSLFGLDSMTALQLATVSPVQELQYISIQHDELLGPEGARLNLSASYSHSKPQGALVALNPLGNSLSLHAGVDYPLLLSLSRTLRIGVGFTSINSKVDLLDIPYSNDRVRYLSLSAHLDFSDALFGYAHFASTLINAKISQGLDVFGATRTGSADLSVANGHSRFTRFNADITRNQRLSGPFSLGIAAAGQISSVPLLSAVRFGLGGGQFARGYEPSEVLGDDGLAGSIEFRYRLSNSGSWFIAPQFYVFYGGGEVWNITPAPGEPKSQSLASAGLGLRFALPHQLAADLELAKPLTRDIASRGNRDVRPLFSLTATF